MVLYSERFTLERDKRRREQHLGRFSFLNHDPTSFKAYVETEKRSISRRQMSTVVWDTPDITRGSITTPARLATYELVKKRYEEERSLWRTEVRLDCLPNRFMEQRFMIQHVGVHTTVRDLINTFRQIHNVPNHWDVSVRRQFKKLAPSTIVVSVIDFESVLKVITIPRDMIEID